MDFAGLPHGMDAALPRPVLTSIKPQAWAVLAAALLIGGCEGFISEPGADDANGPGGPGGGSAAGQNALSPAPRVARLTHQQWENTVRDLFGLSDTTGLSSTFVTDPKTSGYIFDNNANSLSVDQALWSGYQRAATDVVDLVMKDAKVLEDILPPDTGDATARATEFVKSFGRRAYRRPLTDAEVSELVSLFDQAPPLFTGTPAFEAGVRLCLQALLQSPYFLYRIEESNKKVGSVIPLDAWEVASRLSYTLWNTMPDDTLFDAAETGELANQDVVEKQARRMLDDPRAEDVILRFHHALLDIDRYDSISPLAALFPDAPSNLADLAREENRAFLSDVFDNGGGYKEILTSNRTFVNDELAKIYGVSGSFGSELTPVELDATKRRGIFTQIGFLAANATSADPDPIHRGAFLARRIVCLSVAAPPGNVPPLPAAGGRTNRETVTDHTEQPGSTCAGCHSTKINPLGFPFENYDAVGAYRTKDNGFDVDSTASPLVDGQPTPVKNGVELADVLAESPGVHQCYAKHWVEYAFGRKEVPQDDKLVADLGARSRAGDSLKDVLVALVTSKSYLNRSPEVSK